MRHIFASLAITALIATSGVAQAKGSSHPASSNDALVPVLNADIVFPISWSYISYSADGYMMVCLKKKSRAYAYCDFKDDEQMNVEVSAFFKTYFSAVPTVNIVGRTYMGVGSSSYMVFYLNRRAPND